MDTLLSSSNGGGLPVGRRYEVGDGGSPSWTDCLVSITWDMRGIKCWCEAAWVG